MGYSTGSSILQGLIIRLVGIAAVKGELATSGESANKRTSDPVLKLFCELAKFGPLHLTIFGYSLALHKEVQENSSCSGAVFNDEDMAQRSAERRIASTLQIECSALHTLIDSSHHFVPC